MGVRDRTKRIALFIPSLDGGGAQYVMVALANGFSARGYEVDMVLLTARGPYLAALNADVKIVDLKASRVLRGLFPLVRYLRGRKPVTVLATQDHANILAILARAVSGRSVRIVVRVANELSTNTRQNSGIRNSLVKMLVPFMYPKADGIIAVSGGVADDLIQHHGISPEMVTTIFNPVAVPSKIDPGAKLAESEGGSGKVPVVLGVGRLVPQKDFETLIRAFAEVRREREGKLVILGEGRERGFLKQLVKDLDLEQDVSLPGFVEDPFAYMRSCAVFVLSSRHEGMPNVLLQALACGAPVVATDCPSGPSEILEDGRWGRLVPVGEPGPMARAIRAGLDGEIEPVPKQVLDERFGLDRIVEKYLSVLF